MAYRIVYDVLDDAVLPAHREELYWLGFAVVWTLIWAGARRATRKISDPKQRPARGGLVVGGFFICVGILLVTTETLPIFLDQRRCQEWARTGDFQTSEGRINHLIREPGKYPLTHFEVGADNFTFRGLGPKTGGFHGVFTDSKAPEERLREGLPVRIAHHDGRILHIEVDDRMP